MRRCSFPLPVTIVVQGSHLLALNHRLGSWCITHVTNEVVNLCFFPFVKSCCWICCDTRKLCRTLSKPIHLRHFRWRTGGDLRHHFNDLLQCVFRRFLHTMFGLVMATLPMNYGKQFVDLIHLRRLCWREGWVCHRQKRIGNISASPVIQAGITRLRFQVLPETDFCTLIHSSALTIRQQVGDGLETLA